VLVRKIGQISDSEQRSCATILAAEDL